MQSKPNSIPQYTRNTGGAYPRSEAMKYKIPHEKYQVSGAKKNPASGANVVVTNPIKSLGQRNQLDQTLPSYKTPFDLRKSQSKLGGIAGFNGRSTQNGVPLRAQTGIGVANQPPCDPLMNRNF